MECANDGASKKDIETGTDPFRGWSCKKRSPGRLTLFRNNFRRRKMAKKRYAVCGVSSRGLYAFTATDKFIWRSLRMNNFVSLIALRKNFPHFWMN